MTAPVTVVSSGKQWEMHLPLGKLGRKGAGAPYEHELLLDIAAEQLTGAAFDVGAYYGNHTLFLDQVCDLQVHAFEPDLARFAWLAANIDLNDAKVLAFPWALGAEQGQARWVRSKSRKLRTGDGPIIVDAVDELLDVPNLALVKLDIEGMEAQALRGMRRHLARSKPLVYAEAHTREALDHQGRVLHPLGYHNSVTIMAPAPMAKWVPL